MLRRTLIGCLAAMMLVLGACSSEEDAGDRLSVVATTTILGDVVANVIGPNADLVVLLPIGASPHDFVPSAKQVASIYEADLVVANGLGLEEGLGDVLEAAREDGVDVLEIAPHLEPLPFGDGEDLDPHVWMDPKRMETAALAIAKALFLIEEDETWYTRAEGYISDLQAADAQIESLLEDIPPDRRKLVTNHDSLGYFADRYGFEVIGTIVPGGSSLGDPSSAQLAELVAVIEREQVPAIFAETSETQALADVVAAEAGHDVAVVVLLTGSLARQGSPGDTLIGMLLLDAERIAGGLG